MPFLLLLLLLLLLDSLLDFRLLELLILKLFALLLAPTGAADGGATIRPSRILSKAASEGRGGRVLTSDAQSAAAGMLEVANPLAAAGAAVATSAVTAASAITGSDVDLLVLQASPREMGTGRTATSGAAAVGAATVGAAAVAACCCGPQPGGSTVLTGGS